MSDAKIKACPFCGKPPTIKQAGRTNYWWVGCEIHLGPESSGCGVSHSDYDREEAIRKWNERAGDREPAMSKTPEPSTLASATGCAALMDWLKAEMDEDEIAKINARDHGEWDRYHGLEGHRTGLLHVLHHIRAAQHNEKAL